METTCLNCNTEIVQNFCPSCGQKKYKRIDRKYIWEEVQYSTVHMNKGFLYSIKNILKNPGKTARTFIDGNRVNHYKPIGLSFILAGISSFISFKFIGLKEVMTESITTNPNIDRPFMHGYMEFVQTYNSFLILLMIPFFAIFTRWAFKSWGHNYYEHVVLNSYILSYYILLNLIIVYPIMYIFKDDATIVMNVSQMAMISFLVILPYFFKNFYADRTLKNILFDGIPQIASIAYLNPDAVRHLVPKKPSV